MKKPSLWLFVLLCAALIGAAYGQFSFSASLVILQDAADVTFYQNNTIIVGVQDSAGNVRTDFPLFGDQRDTLSLVLTQTFAAFTLPPDNTPLTCTFNADRTCEFQLRICHLGSEFRGRISWPSFQDTIFTVFTSAFAVGTQIGGASPDVFMFIDLLPTDLLIGVPFSVRVVIVGKWKSKRSAGESLNPLFFLSFVCVRV